MLLRVPALAALWGFATARESVKAGQTPDVIDGIKILKADRHNKTFVTSMSIMDKLSFTQDPHYNDKLKAGELKSIKFTQQDVDLIARTTVTGHFDFYSELPIARTLEQFNELPAIFDVPKGANIPSHKGFMRRHRRGHMHKRGPTEQQVSLIPVIPELDAFYLPARDSYVNLEKGTPIAFRRVTSLYTAQLAQMFQLTYRTEDSHTGANADLTTVFVPRKVRNDFFVTYQMHEDGNQLFCAYSYLYRTGLTDVPLQTFLDNQYPISVTDYEGPKSVFGAYYRSGKSILDSIRAVRASLPQLQIETQKSFLYGYSAGATATGMAAELLPEYAPELNGIVAGMAVGGYVTNMQATFDAVNKAHFAGLIPMSIGNLMSEYPSFKDFILSHVTPLGSAQLAVSSVGCSPTLYLFLGQDMYGITNLGRDFMKDPAASSIILENSPGRKAPPMPVFFLQTTSDEVAPIAAFEDVVNLYCQGGTPVAWHKADTDGHGAYENHMPEFVPQFFQSIATGASQAKQCSSWQDVAFV